MTDPQPDLFGNLDEAVCRCSRCTSPQTLAWPERRQVETVKVTRGRL